MTVKKWYDVGEHMNSACEIWKDFLKNKRKYRLNLYELKDQPLVFQFKIPRNFPRM